MNFREPKCCGGCEKCIPDLKGYESPPIVCGTFDPSLPPPQSQTSRDLDEAVRQRDNLLARIHRDGGHYTEQHGVAKSVEDADRRVAEAYGDLAEAVRLLRDALDHCVGCDACMHTSEFLARVGNRALNVGLFNAIYALAPGDLGGEG